MTENRIPEDTMTPKERIAAVIAGRPFDRIPCIPSMGEHAALVITSRFRSTISPRS